MLVARGKGSVSGYLRYLGWNTGNSQHQFANPLPNLPPCPRCDVLQGPYSSRRREKFSGQLTSTQVDQTSLAMFHVKHRACLPSARFTWNILYLKRGDFTLTLPPRQSCFTWNTAARGHEDSEISREQQLGEGFPRHIPTRNLTGLCCPPTRPRNTELQFYEDSSTKKTIFTPLPHPLPKTRALFEFHVKQAV